MSRWAAIQRPPPTWPRVWLQVPLIHLVHAHHAPLSRHRQEAVVAIQQLRGAVRVHHRQRLTHEACDAAVRGSK